MQRSLEKAKRAGCVHFFILYNILLNKPRKRAAQLKKGSQSKLKPAADKMAVFAEVLKCGDAVLAASPISLSESLLSPLKY